MAARLATPGAIVKGRLATLANVLHRPGRLRWLSLYSTARS